MYAYLEKGSMYVAKCVVTTNIIVQHSGDKVNIEY